MGSCLRRGEPRAGLSTVTIPHHTPDQASPRVWSWRPRFVLQPGDGQRPGAASLLWAVLSGLPVSMTSGPKLEKVDIRAAQLTERPPPPALGSHKAKGRHLCRGPLALSAHLGLWAASAWRKQAAAPLPVRRPPWGRRGHPGSGDALHRPSEGARGRQSPWPPGRGADPGPRPSCSFPPALQHPARLQEAASYQMRWKMTPLSLRLFCRVSLTPFSY